ncbi:hypothetical protein Pmani_039501 [Petrolisthes manimaculis]|uniref:Uncharacterized protein n=1 Tax=Petrolisthes manimaculis TaxID=1843537 RepID=A0AAE1NDJ5_9EUCA|nr:hypothetical protein Pmani_039501 [Petrolisthes manimaculis]
MGGNIRMAGSSLNGVPIVYKRKPEDEPEEVKPLTKQHISEERMAAHLNSLHLSHTYYNHRLGKKCARKSTTTTTTTTTTDEDLDELDSDEEDGGGGGCGGERGDDTGGGGARLILSREVKAAMGNGESPLPTSLLERLRKPRMEVVLWQPPPTPPLQPPPSLSLLTTTTTTTPPTTTSSNNGTPQNGTPQKGAPQNGAPVPVEPQGTSGGGGGSGASVGTPLPSHTTSGGGVGGSGASVGEDEVSSNGFHSMVESV